MIQFSFSIPIARVEDETKLWLSPSAKQRRNPWSGLSTVYQNLRTRYDWRIKNAMVDLPIKMKGTGLKRSPGKSLSLVGVQKLLRRRY